MGYFRQFLIVETPAGRFQGGRLSSEPHLAKCRTNDNIIEIVPEREQHRSESQLRYTESY
jgi:hypothetical protein